MKVKVKFGLSLGMWVLAWIMAIVGSFSYDRKFILFAMTACFIGDIFLMWYGRGKKYRKHRYFILGMVSFAVAHLLYFEAFSSRIPKPNLDALIGAILGLVLFCCSLGIFIVKFFDDFKNNISRLKEKLVFAGLIYLSILGVNMVIIFGYACYIKTIFAFLPAVGIVCFLVSDYLIAVRELLNKRSKKVQRWIWFLYVLGQTMIIIS